MKTKMRETSLLAYAEALEHLGENQQQVLITMRLLKTANNQMIAEKLGWQINSITPRVKELRDKKLAQVAFTAPDLFTGRKTIYWKPTRRQIW